MTTLTTGMQLVLLIAGAITIVAMLSVFANVIAHETQLHDLRNRVKDLHYKHAMYLARLDGRIGEETNAEILPDTLAQELEPQLAEFNTDSMQLEAQSLPGQPDLPQSQAA